jgi:hypothetical protein
VARGARHGVRMARGGTGASVRRREVEGRTARGRRHGGAEARRQEAQRCKGLFEESARRESCRVARHEAGGAGAHGARRVRPVRTDGRPDSSIIISYWEASIIAKANCKPFGFLDNHLVNGGWSEFIDILDVSRAAQLPEWTEVSDLVGPLG